MGFLGKRDKNRKSCVQIRVFLCPDVMTKGTYIMKTEGFQSAHIGTPLVYTVLGTNQRFLIPDSFSRKPGRISWREIPKFLAENEIWPRFTGFPGRILTGVKKTPLKNPAEKNLPKRLNKSPAKTIRNSLSTSLCHLHSQQYSFI